MTATSLTSPSTGTIQQSITVSYWDENHRPRYTVVETKTRGKGKVIVDVVDHPHGEGGVDVRGRTRSSGKGVQRIAAVSELDAQHGALPSDPPARVDGRLEYRYVAAIRRLFSAYSLHLTRVFTVFPCVLGGCRTARLVTVRRACMGRCGRCGPGCRCCCGL